MGGPIVFIICVLFLISYLVYKFAKKKVEKEVLLKASNVMDNNEPLRSPCIIHIKVNNNVSTQIGGPWRYGFSLNGQPPVFTILGGEMELITNVKHNTLLGYGRGTYGGYKKPNIEEPFRFDAADGGIIRLIADVKFAYQNDAMWKSNLSVEE